MVSLKILQIVDCCIALFVAINMWRFVPFRTFVGVLWSIPTIRLDVSHFTTMAAAFTFVFVALVCVFLDWAVCSSVTHLMTIVAFASKGCQCHFCVISIVACDCFCFCFSLTIQASPLLVHGFHQVLESYFVTFCLLFCVEDGLIFIRGSVHYNRDGISFVDSR